MKSSHIRFNSRSISRLESILISTTLGIPLCAKSNNALGLNMDVRPFAKELRATRFQWVSHADRVLYESVLSNSPLTWEKSSSLPAWTRFASKGANFSLRINKCLKYKSWPSNLLWAVEMLSLAIAKESLHMDTASWARSSNTV